MAGLSYNDTELRKLSPSFRLKIAQFLDVNDSWKKLMASIPADLNHMDVSKPKYSMEHINLIERYARTTNASNSRLCSEILLDEWSTSGKIRPTVEILYKLLQKCQLYRAADYIAIEILDVPLPERPKEGPAKQIPSPSTTERLRNLEFLDYPSSDAAAAVQNERNPDDLNIVIEQLTNYDYVNGNIVQFSIESLQKVTNNFHENFAIGSGAFGTVYVINLQGKAPPLAVKLLNMDVTLVEDQFLTEIRVLSKYRHENLLSLIGFCTGPKYCLVYEFMCNGSLLEAIASTTNPLGWATRLTILHGVSKGINFLHTGHEKPLVHRDIKSANILLNEQYVAKIGDFGLAKSFSNTNQTSALTSTILGSSAYMSPEAFRGDISPKMDIFSFGVVIMEVLTGLPPYDEEREGGHDIVTYLEEAVEDAHIVPLLDNKAGYISSNHALTLYSIGQVCLAEKKKRPTSEVLVNNLGELIASCDFNDKDCF